MPSLTEKESPEENQSLSRLDTIRMSLDLSPEMKAVIDNLARKTGRSKAEVLRQAIALLKVVKEAEDCGESPALIDRTGKVTARLVGV